MRVSSIIFILLINTCFGQSDQRSILEVFLEKENLQLYDFEFSIVMNGEEKQVIHDRNGFFSFPFSNYYKQKVTVNIQWKSHKIVIPNLSPTWLIDKRIEIAINEFADSSCVYVSYYDGCTVTPATLREECPEGHEVNFFTIPIISEELYHESDSMAKLDGIPIDMFLNSLPFTSKEAYIEWIQNRRK